MTGTARRFSARRLLAEALACVGYRRFQQKYWDLRSADIVARYSFTEDLPLLEGLARRFTARSVVDIGCGSGRAFEAYRRAAVERIVGIELAPAMVARARAKAEALGSGVTVLAHDIREPLPEGLSCDLLVSSRVLQHIHPRDIARTLSHLLLLKPRGIYLNEALEPGRSAYLFSHDYEALLMPHGFGPPERGMVPKIDYEYLLFSRSG